MMYPLRCHLFGHQFAAFTIPPPGIEDDGKMWYHTVLCMRKKCDWKNAFGYPKLSAYKLGITGTDLVDMKIGSDDRGKTPLIVVHLTIAPTEAGQHFVRNLMKVGGSTQPPEEEES